MHLASPDEPLTCDSVGARSNRERRVRCGAEALGHVVDRAPPKATRPGERVQGAPFHVRPRSTSCRQCLERPGFRLANALDANDRRVARHLREHGRPQLRVAVAFGERTLEASLYVAEAADCALGQEQPGTHPRRPRRQRIQLRREQIGHPLMLTRDREVRGEREQSVVALGRLWRRQAQRVLSQLDRFLSCTARRRPCGRAVHRGGKLRVRPLGCESKVTRAKNPVCHRACQCKVHLAALARARAPLRRRGVEWVRGAHPAVVDEQEPGVEGVVKREWLDRGELRNAEPST